MSGHQLQVLYGEARDRSRAAALVIARGSFDDDHIGQRQVDDLRSELDPAPGWGSHHPLAPARDSLLVHDGTRFRACIGQLSYEGEADVSAWVETVDNDRSVRIYVTPGRSLGEVSADTLIGWASTGQMRAGAVPATRVGAVTQ